MATYLVDFENVNSAGLNGVEQLNDADIVIVFYSEQANTLTISMHNKLNQSKAKINFIKIVGKGPNCLDFQLSTYLGYLISQNKSESFYIVSKDKGFENTTLFWEQRGTCVMQVNNLLKQSPKSIRKKLEELIPQYENDIDVIAEFIEKYKTKQGFNNALIKQFGSDKTGLIYKAVKTLLSDKKGK